ncbi:MAG: succinylglutamate desuccinylase/aspartoacylase family protein [Candidatus Paceibacterota bacterium]|jgi:succinylglutamate desuccinylase
MYEDVIELIGKEAGPTSIILAGVHGNERCGVEALNKIAPSLEINRGKVFILYGNPRAIEQDIRFTEANLNRMFRLDEEISEEEKGSYEYSRAQFLKKYLDQSDVLLDIHASYTPKSPTFIICEENSRNITKNLPFEIVVSGFDQVEPGGTDYYMNTTGKIGICVECGYLKDAQSVENAEKSIHAFLCARGHKDDEKQKIDQTNIQMYKIYLSETNFELAKEFYDFEEIKSGQIIGKDGEKEIFAPKDSIILFARNIKKAGDEAFLLGEYKKI